MFTSFILCVVPENTHTLPTEANGNSEGMEIRKEAIYEGVRGGGAFRGMFFGGLCVRMVSY